MSFFDLFQLAGGVLLSIGYIPQLIHLWQVKKSSQFSVTWLIQLVVGICFMEVYAIHLTRFGTWAFVVTNTTSLVLSSLLLILVLRYRN